MRQCDPLLLFLSADQVLSYYYVDGLTSSLKACCVSIAANEFRGSAVRSGVFAAMRIVPRTISGRFAGPASLRIWADSRCFRRLSS